MMLATLTLATLAHIAGANYVDFVDDPFTDPNFPEFHPRPLKNWMNDPNGPIFYNGVYHLWCQYNPESVKWGNMHWYHMASTDLLHWKHLPISLSIDKEDCGGVFTGSTTIVDGKPVISYSVACGSWIIQAVPTNLSDPWLTAWEKTGIAYDDPVTVTGGFRDPTTAWKGADGMWRQCVGCKFGACLFKSTNFFNWTFTDGALNEAPALDFWECPDFFPIPGSKLFVLKGSTKGHDEWAVGSVTEGTGIDRDHFVASSAAVGAMPNQKYDYGQFYASKSFFDPVRDRQLLFGWVAYTCPNATWAGSQTFPRSITLDPANHTRILTLPIAEISQLYIGDPVVLSNVALTDGTPVGTNVSGLQFDISATFTFPDNVNASSVGIVWNSMTFSVESYELPRVTRPTMVEWRNNLDITTGSTMVELRLFIDRSIYELFVDGGRSVLTKTNCNPKDTQIYLVGGTGSVATSVTINSVASAAPVP